MQAFALIIPGSCVMHVDLLLNMLPALPQYQKENFLVLCVKETFTYRFVLSPPQLFFTADY